MDVGVGVGVGLGLAALHALLGVATLAMKSRPRPQDESPLSWEPASSSTKSAARWNSPDKSTP